MPARLTVWRAEPISDSAALGNRLNRQKSVLSSGFPVLFTG
jgi:hypothetical protein